MQRVRSVIIFVFANAFKEDGVVWYDVWFLKIIRMGLNWLLQRRRSVIKSKFLELMYIGQPFEIRMVQCDNSFLQMIYITFLFFCSCSLPGLTWNFSSTFQLILKLEFIMDCLGHSGLWLSNWRDRHSHVVHTASQ